MYKEQSTFKFDTEPSYLDEDFIISSSNVDAFNLVNNSDAWIEKTLYLYGEVGCGKTHLAHIFQHTKNAKFIKNLGEFEEGIRHYIIDDINEKIDERFLLHTINIIRENGWFLLVTAQNKIEFQLPDLKSRIQAMQKISINKPDDELLKAMLSKMFSDRQIQVKLEVIEYAMKHIERNLSVIKILSEKLDELSLLEKRSITIPLLKKLLIFNS